MIKTVPNKKKCKKAKWLSEEALHIAVKRSERQRRKGKICPFECRVPKNSKERQTKTIEWERLEISSRKCEIPREHFMQ